MPENSIVHVCFGAAEPTLRQAAARAGWAEDIAATADVFTLGPIAGATAAARAQAVNELLGTSEWATTVADNGLLLAASLAPDIQPIVWFSRRDTQSYAGFLWWLSHRGDDPCDVVDLTETRLPARERHGENLPSRLAVSPSLVPWEDLVDLRKESRTLSASERRYYREMWQRLARENTPLRVIENGELVSAPISYFDPLLLSHVIDQWRKMARVIGTAMMDGFYADGLRQVGDLFLHMRLRALVEAGVIEAQGDPRRMRYCEVRRWPGGKAAS